MNEFESKLAIKELIARYNYSLDHGDYDTWLDCWAENAVMDGLGMVLSGKHNIRSFAENYDAKYRLPLNGLKHFTVNTLSDVDGDRAISTSYLQLTRTDKEGVHIIFTASYHDELECVDGTWRFTLRKLNQDMP